MSRVRLSETRSVSPVIFSEAEQLVRAWITLQLATKRHAIPVNKFVWYDLGYDKKRYHMMHWCNYDYDPTLRF